MSRLITILLLASILMFDSCSSCSRSGRRDSNNKNSRQDRQSPRQNARTEIYMEKVGGVYQVPLLINGVKMFFIFDTGASSIAISETEALFLYKQGKLKDEDILGKQNFIDANGDISEGTLINLRKVEIGDRVLRNVQASITHNLNAPLLFGQSALERFGRIEIDNKNGKLIIHD